MSEELSPSRAAVTLNPAKQLVSTPAGVAASAGDHAATLAGTAPGAMDTTLDPRSAEAVATLLPAAQRAARRFLAEANDGQLGAGITVKIICGTRSYAEQTALFAQGRTTHGPIVTNAPAGYSNHNFGIAFDIGIFDRGAYLEDSPLYATAGALGRIQGLEWGGDWASFRDEPHFQLPWTGSLADARALVCAGKWERCWT